jgi:peptidoglycan/LPS O-acetylase OafA/YrhL
MERFRTRNGAIDLMRGVCVMLVVLSHIHLRFYLEHYPVRGALPRAVERIVFSSGYYAVIAFFVISGFLIALLSLRRWGELGQISIAQFYLLRCARIAPCLLLLLCVLAALHLAGVPGFVISEPRASLGRALLAALTFHVNWLEGHHGYLPRA